MRRAFVPWRASLQYGRIQSFKRRNEARSSFSTSAYQVSEREPKNSDEEYDVVVVGSGAGGLVSALSASVLAKHRVLVAEKTNLYGGTSAISGGAVWLPNNHLASAQGYHDSREQVERFLRASVGSDYNPELASAFLDSAPDMCQWLEETGASRFVSVPAPDYHTEFDGASKAGRTLLEAPYDGRRLGQLVNQIRYPLQGLCAFGTMQIDILYQKYWLRPFASLRSLSYVIKSILRYAYDYLRYGKGTNLCNGNALIGRLVEAAVKSNVNFWNNASVTQITMDGGSAVGVEIRIDGKTFNVRARKGIVLAGGGFSRSAELTRQHLPTRGWTVSPRGNQGDGLRMGQEAGGVLPPVPTIDRALYAPISEMYRGSGPIRSYPHLSGITKPGSIVVDGDGKRFANESAPYQDFGQASVASGVHEQYLIATQQHLKRYGMGMALPAPYPIGHLLRNGYLIKASTIAELARKLKIDAGTLCATVDRFNKFAKTGKDLDFGRGDASYDQNNGDPDVKPNRCLAPLETGPFFAVRMHLGTAVTMYGLQTDRDARVLDRAGQPIDGLYAAGADSNHFLNGKYPTGGLTLAHAMVFGYRAGVHLQKSANLN